MIFLLKLDYRYFLFTIEIKLFYMNSTVKNPIGAQEKFLETIFVLKTLLNPVKKEDKEKKIDFEKSFNLSIHRVLDRECNRKTGEFLISLYRSGNPEQTNEIKLLNRSVISEALRQLLVEEKLKQEILFPSDVMDIGLDHHLCQTINQQFKPLGIVARPTAGNITNTVFIVITKN